MRTRIALFAAGSLMGLFACNGLTGIGDYSVAADAPALDAASDAIIEASTSPDTGASDAGDASCVYVDHEQRSPDKCELNPGGNIGSDMAPLSFGFHCVDVTEVTVDQYQVFLAERGATNTCGQPAECAWNTTYAPSPSEAATPPGDTPQVNIDWCDAFMYCRWAGKNLCGSFDFSQDPPGNLPWAEEANLQRDLWYAFCTASGPTALPNDYFYGRTSVPGTCQDATRTSTIGRVGGAPDCHGAIDSRSANVYDMAGNAAEWTWSCEGESCLTRGGSYLDSNPANLACAGSVPANRRTQSPSIGFRCCVQ